MRTLLRSMAVVAIVMVAAGGGSANVEVTVDGNRVQFDSPVLMVDMVFALVPAEPYLMALGATVDWDPAAEMLTARRGAVTLQMAVGTEHIVVNGAPQTMAYGAQTLSGVPYVPAAAVARLLGLDASWDGESLQLAVAVPVEMPEGDIFVATLLEVRPGDPVGLVIRSTEDAVVYLVSLDDGAPLRRGRVGMTPMGTSLSEIQPGDLLEIVLSEAGTARGLTATFEQAMGTVESIAGNRLQLAAGPAYPLGAGVAAVGSDGNPLHLLGTAGEAAILRLNPATDEVWSILSQRRGSITPPDTPTPIVAGFFLPTYYSPLKAGDSLDLRIVGSAGARATVVFGGSGRSVTVPETQPGVYESSFTVPNGMNVANEALVAELAAGGRTSEQVRSDSTVLVDTTQPTISELQPADGSETNQRTPMIGARFEDPGPAELDRNSLLLSVNGRDVLEAATVQADGFSYMPPELAPGMHSVSVSISDTAGNVTARTWHFRVSAEQQVIQNVQHDAVGPLRTGDTLTVTMQVAAVGREASFDVDGVQAGIPMARVAGTTNYVGTYTIRDADRAAGATITAHFTDANGRDHTVVAAQPVTITGPQITFGLTTPTDGARVARRITPQGTAPPGLRVRWAITYRKVILGGEVDSGTVVADQTGVWRGAREVNLSIPLIGLADVYTMTAELLDERGDVIETITANFRAGD